MQHISDYLHEHKPNYRQPTLQKLYSKIRRLKDAPFSGRIGRVEGTRELLFSPMPYVVVYVVNHQTIEIWRVYHASQNLV
jgi:toxin ParE1/3/4